LVLVAFLPAVARPPDPANDLLPIPEIAEPEFPPVDETKVELGKLLFYDKILSGNRNISCATCHHALAGSGDGLSLSCGEGARGLGVTRNTGSGVQAIPERVPRNAPPLYNLGALEFRRLFHDGRLEVDPTEPSGFRSPAGEQLPLNLDSLLAAQAMFPVTSTTEMAGQPGENRIADAAAAGELAGAGGVWSRLAERLRSIPEYEALFVEAFDDVHEAADIEYSHAANAIAAYEAAVFRADDSPFDRYVRGERSALSRAERRGMQFFYGRAGCSDCHSGVFQTDQEFYAIAMPQIGPGKGDNLPGYEDGHDDFGRERVTGDPDDRFRFRTLPLRNVALTGPWGHDGAYDTLEAVVRHHLDPVAAMEAYDISEAVLPSRRDLDLLDRVCLDDPVRRDAVAAACELDPSPQPDFVVERLLDFLHALTDPAMLDVRESVPEKVPSGLPVFD
jgi:cytochrome c peroxidase